MTTGFPSVDDFLIRIIPYQTMRNIDNGNGTIGGIKPSFTDMTETDFVMVKLNMLSDEPYLFFGPNNSRTTSLNHDFIRHYHFLVCNSGFGKFKKAIFYTIGSIESNVKRFDIDKIPPSYLEKLRDFILKKRTQEYPTFCNTIYNTIVAKLEQ